MLNKIKDKSITRNIFRIQDDESIMRRFYCIACIEYMFAGKTLLDYTNLFSPNYYKRNEKKYINTLRINMAEEVSLSYIKKN